MVEMRSQVLINGKTGPVGSSMKMSGKPTNQELTVSLGKVPQVRQDVRFRLIGSLLF